MEPWRGWEGESIAHMGKGEAFLGKGARAGLTEEGTSNALRIVSNQPYSRREGKSINQKHSEYTAENPHSLALCRKQDTFPCPQGAGGLEDETDPPPFIY